MTTKSKEVSEMLKQFERADFDALPNCSPFEDAEVISAYSRAEALEDGILIDVSKDAAEVGITLPTAITQSAWSEFVVNPKWSEWGPELIRLKRLLNCAISEIERLPKSSKTVGTTVFFSMDMTKSGKVVDRLDFRVSQGPGDNFEQVLTVMMNHED